MPISWAIALGPAPVGVQRPHTAAVDALHPTLIPTGALGLGDPFRLALAAHVGLESGEDREHAEEGATGRGRSIHLLLQHLEIGASLLDLVRYVSQIADRAAKAIKTRHHQSVAIAQAVQHLAQLLALVAFPAGDLLLEDRLHASLAQRLLLHGEVLVDARYARISQQLAHGGPPM